MLKTIAPKSQYYYRSRVEVLLGAMRLYQDIPLIPEEQAISTFIIGENHEAQMYGGAVLYQKGVGDLHPRLAQIVSSLDPHKEDVWVGTVSYFTDNNKPLMSAQEHSASQKFYKTLFEAFLEFGHQQKAGFLCLTLNPSEHLRTKNKGFWPYVIEVTPQESLDKLFHGILPLSETKEKTNDVVRLSPLLSGQSSLAA